MKTVCFIPLLVVYVSIYAQPDLVRFSKEDYIEKYKQDAVKDMKLTGVPASITLAQGILESECGNSKLAREANNHFGIKCHKEWNGPSYYQDDDQPNECFRRYNSVLESFDDHSNFLRTRDRYSFLFELPVTDYKAWAHGLKKAGYATNPEYAHKLIKIIEDFNLHELDREGGLVASAKKNSVKKPSYRFSEKQPVKTASAPVHQSSNHVPYVIASVNETYLSIAIANKTDLWQILKYNEADKNDTPSPGEIVYLKPKRNKAEQKFHIVAEGETMRYISQLYAVKLKKLYRYNNMNGASEPKAGQKLALR